MTLVKLPVEDPFEMYGHVEFDEFVLKVYDQDRHVYFPRQERVILTRIDDSYAFESVAEISLEEDRLKIMISGWRAPVFVQMSSVAALKV